MKTTAIIFGILSAVIVLVGVWWWALWGMTFDVGQAVIVTACVFAIGSFVAAMAQAWEKI